MSIPFATVYYNFIMVKSGKMDLKLLIFQINRSKHYPRCIFNVIGKREILYSFHKITLGFIFLNLMLTTLSSCRFLNKNQLLIAKKVDFPDGINKYPKVRTYIINDEGAIISKGNYLDIDTIVTEEDYFIAEVPDSGWIYLKLDESPLINSYFDKAEAFNSLGYAKVESSRKCGYIDKRGKYIIPVLYDDLGEFKENLVSCKINGKLGFINEKGKIVIPPIFDFPQFEENFSDEEFYFADSFEFSEGLARVKSNGYFGYIGKDGQFKIKPTFALARNFINGYAVVAIEDTVVDTSADNSSFFRKQIRKSFGIIDKKGNWVIHPQFGEILLAKNYFIALNTKWALMGGGYSYYKYSGEKLFNKEFIVTSESYIYEHIFRNYLFVDSIAFASLDDSSGYINMNGDFVISPKYFESDNVYFNNGFAVVGYNYSDIVNYPGEDVSQRYRAYMVINKNGEIEIPPAFRYINNVGNGIFEVMPIQVPHQLPSIGKIYYIDNNGNYIWKGF